MLGKCLCGQIEFKLAVAHLKLYQCHCSLCRKQGGSSSNSSAIVPFSRFQWLTGEELISSWVKDSGFRSDFCSCCGSPVPNPLRDKAYYWVPAGLIESDAMDISTHLFLGSKASWDVAPHQGIQYDTAPELNGLISDMVDN